MLKRHKRWVIWIAILLLSAMLRLPGPDWDSGYALHPDERYLLDLSSKMTVYGDPCAVDPHYPYGHLPLNLVRILFPSTGGTDPLYPARLFSGMMSVLLVAITGASGLALGHEFTGWFSALAIVFAPLLVQSARFYTVDNLATIAATLAILAVIRKRWGIAGISGAMAVASKISLIWVWLVLVLSVFWADELDSKANIPLPMRLHNLSILAVCGGLTYVMVSPWMLLNVTHCWSGPFIQWQVVTGRVVYPYTLQYAGTIPYLYPFKQMALWGFGPLCTIIGIGTTGAGFARWRQMGRGQRIALVWVAWYTLMMAGLYVKFPRYLLPLYPWIAIMAGQAIEGLFPSSRYRTLRLSGMILCLLPTVVMGISQASIYASSHPWVRASQWLTKVLDPGDAVAYESWDYPLPLLNISNPYVNVELPIYDDESAGKAERLTEAIESADVIVIASRRGIGALSHNSQQYAQTLAWYKSMLTERKTLVFTRCPHFGPLAFSDDFLSDSHLPGIISLRERCNTPFVLRLPQLDESFRVYDAPMAILLYRASQ